MLKPFIYAELGGSPGRKAGRPAGQEGLLPSPQDGGLSGATRGCFRAVSTGLERREVSRARPGEEQGTAGADGSSEGLLLQAPEQSWKLLPQLPMWEDGTETPASRVTRERWGAL